MPKTEYDLLKEDKFPSNYIQVFEDILAMRKAALDKDIYIASDVYGQSRHGQMVIVIAGNSHTLIPKAELDDDFTKYLAKEHEKSKFIWVPDPNYVPPEQPEIDIPIPETDEDDYDEDDYCDCEECESAPEIPKIKLFDDVIQLTNEEMLNRALGNCEAVAAMVALGIQLNCVRGLICKGEVRLYVAIGNNGFIYHM